MFRLLKLTFVIRIFLVSDCGQVLYDFAKKPTAFLVIRVTFFLVYFRFTFF